MGKMYRCERFSFTKEEKNGKGFDWKNLNLIQK